MARPCMASRHICVLCLALAARLAPERPVPKPLQAFLRVAIAAARHCQSRVMLDDRQRKKSQSRS